MRQVLQTLTFMSLTESHKNQLHNRCTERSPGLPMLSLSLSPLRALSTTKHSVPNLNTLIPQLHSLTIDLQLFKPSLCLSFSVPHFSTSTALDPFVTKRVEGVFRGSPLLPHLEL